VEWEGRRYLLLKQHSEVRDARGRLVGFKWTHMALVPVQKTKPAQERGRKGG
jgi:hypothetical protein